METYIIYEHQTRPDGIINVVSPVTRQSFASALSYYYDRCSKMVMTDLYTSVSIMLTDEKLNAIKHDTLNTLYVPPVEEPVEEPVED